MRPWPAITLFSLSTSTRHIEVKGLNAVGDLANLMLRMQARILRGKVQIVDRTVHDGQWIIFVGNFCVGRKQRWSDFLSWRNSCCLPGIASFAIAKVIRVFVVDSWLQSSTDFINFRRRLHGI